MSYSKTYDGFKAALDILVTHDAALAERLEIALEAIDSANTKCGPFQIPREKETLDQFEEILKAIQQLRKGVPVESFPNLYDLANAIHDVQKSVGRHLLAERTKYDPKKLAKVL